MLRFLVLLCLAVLPAKACLWDRDTLREEAKGKLDTVRAITGWFDRHPPRYYEMRLTRVTAELAASPQSLNLYDDAGVACSRLNRHDEAIAWMEKKKAILDALPDAGPAEDRYRYLSNLGTFHLIRWITTDESVRSVNLGDLKASETHIAKALELNPDAHFGREKYQLMLIRWLLGKEPRYEGKLCSNFLYLPGKANHTPEFTPEQARQGITGLIQLGAAWESIDCFHALGYSLRAEGTWHLAYLATLRQEELVNTGLTSFQPDEAVRKHIEPLLLLSSTEDAEPVHEYYQKARVAAREREAAWLAYQEERFAQGMHPDTHSEFWNEWKEPAFPKLPGPTLKEYIRRHLLLSLTAFVIFLCFLLSLPKLLRRRKRTIEAPATATA
jgi:tetratricopeptide (TPR) repeat protein